MLTALPPSEVRILQLRYGLLDGQAYAPDEVGRKLGITRERVRQIEAQALSRLMTNWPIILDALRQLWEMRKVSELKSPFYEPVDPSKTDGPEVKTPQTGSFGFLCSFADSPEKL